MKWSQLKKRIEDTFADSVRGRVEVWNTRYRKSHDQEGEAWITIDKKRVHSMGTITYWMEANREAERLRKERDCTDSKDPVQFERYWDAYHEALQTVEDRGILPLWESYF